MLIEPRGLVLADASGKQLGFPGAGGGFEAFKLSEDGADRIRALHASCGGDALPLEQEAQEVAHLDGLDFGAQTFDCVAVNAREEAPLTPLAGAASRLGSELAAHREAFSLQHRQRSFDLARRQANGIRHDLRGNRSETLQPAANDFNERLLTGPLARMCRGHLNRGLDLRFGK